MAIEHSLTGRLIYAGRQCRSLRAEHLRRFELHAGQDELLQCLMDHDGMSMGELARALGVRPPTVSKTVARMEAKGLLKRQQSPSDTRRNDVYLTSKGRRLADNLQTAWQAVEALAFDGLKEKDTRRLTKLLAKITANLDTVSAPRDDYAEPA